MTRTDAKETTYIRTLLVDDETCFLTLTARLLEADSRFEIVGTARTGHEALNQVERLHPDLVLMDLNMPGMDGLEAIRRLKEQPDAPRVVMLTMCDRPGCRAEAEAAGADGFVSKPELIATALPLIHILSEQ